MRPLSLPRPSRARRWSAGLALVVALGSLPVLPVPGTAAAAPSATAELARLDPTTLAAPSPDLADLPAVSVELAQIPVSSPTFERAAASYAEVNASLTSARDARLRIDRTRTAGRVDSQRYQAIRIAALARADGLTRRLDAVEGAIRDLAVQSFVAGGNTQRVSQALTSESPSINETDQRATLGQLSMDVLLAERAGYRQRIDQATQRADEATAALVVSRDSGQEASAARPEALTGEAAAGEAVASERVVYEQARVLATVEGVEFPLVALDAYYRAAATEAAARPGCGIEWWGIAGIAKVEGHHGTYGGATLDANGDTTRRIIGIQLNGTNQTAVITDTDGGALDGDAAFDRAVGPMQFIPSTWRAYEADGNDDGEKSPFNMYDATLAAANYLCTASGGLDADPGLRRAYFAYNHSLAYVDHVLRYARGYEQRIDVPERRA